MRCLYREARVMTAVQRFRAWRTRGVTEEKFASRSIARSIATLRFPLTQIGRPAGLVRPAAGGRALTAMTISGLSSLKNLLLSVAVARVETISGVGQFAITFSIYVLATGLARAVVTESVLAVGLQPGLLGRGARRVSAVGATIGMFVATSGLLIDSPYLAIAGVALPGLVLYDYNKTISLGVRRTRTAFAQEMVWTSLTGLAVLLSVLQVVNVLTVFSVWAGSGALIGYVAARLLRYPVLPSWDLSHSETKIAVSFGGQFLVTAGSAQLAITTLAVTAGTAVVGALSAGRTLLGPITLLSGTASSLIIPYLARTRSAPLRAQLRAAISLMVLVVGLAAPLALALLILPEQVGVAMLGGNWSAAQPLLPALAVESLLIVPALVGFAGHRIQQAGPRALLLGSVMGLMRVVVVVAGGAAFGARGAAYAMVVMGLISVVVWWGSYVLLLRRMEAAGSIAGGVRGEAVSGRNEPLPLRS
jgi:O-antigen/teichoic acid export membrane protein